MMSTTHRRPAMAAASGVIALALVSALVVRTSEAAFTATTNNTDNSFAAGSLALTNDHDGDGRYAASTTAEFAVTDLAPGDSGAGCIDVRYGGTLTGADLGNVAFYVANVNDTDGGAGAGQLSGDLDVVVAVHDAGETCTTAVGAATVVQSSAALSAYPTTFAAGADSGWQPSASGEVRAFEFTWTLGADTTDGAQGDSVTVDFVWEVNAGV